MSAESAPDLPQEAYAVALASMPSMGPARLRTLLAADPPARAWERANEGSRASVRDVARAWQRQTSLGIRVLLAGQPGYPARLVDDPQAPALLFCLGDPTALAGAPDRCIGGHACADPLWHRRRRTVRRRSLRGWCQRGLGSGPGDRRCRARGGLWRRRAACRCRGGRAGPRLPAAARAPVGAGGVVGGHRVRVPGGGAHGEVALSGPQPPSGRTE